MTTVNLELSRQLQERWPEWGTGHWIDPFDNSLIGYAAKERIKQLKEER